MEIAEIRADDFCLFPIRCFGCILGFGALHGDSNVDRVGTNSVLLSARVNSAIGARPPLHIRPCTGLSLDATTVSRGADSFVALRIRVPLGRRVAFGAPVPPGARTSGCGAANCSTRGIAAGPLLISARRSGGKSSAGLI